MTISLIRSR